MSLTQTQLKLTAVAVEHAEHTNMPPLRHAVSETRDVVDLATKAGVSSSFDPDMACKEEVLANLQSSQIVHLACHGIQHEREPYKSYFCLRTSNLTISELAEMKLKDAFLAYLSACETAKGDADYGDEAIHLAASMLFAGFKSVVATMWSVI
jgi:CHAT domain-containing protein